MTTEIRQSELRHDNAVVMRRVAAGESFVVTVNGRPVADVAPHQRDAGKRRFVSTAAAAAALTATPISQPDDGNGGTTSARALTTRKTPGSVRPGGDEQRAAPCPSGHVGAERPPPVQQVSRHADGLAVSVTAIAELQYGLTAATDPLEQAVTVIGPPDHH